MSVHVYFPPKQNVKIRLQCNNLVNRDKVQENLIEEFEFDESVCFYPFNYIQGQHGFFTIHIFTSRNIQNVIHFDRFDIDFPDIDGHMKLMVERTDPLINKRIMVAKYDEYNNLDKQYFPFTNINWDKHQCMKFLKDERSEDFYIELCRDKFLIIKQYKEK